MPDRAIEIPPLENLQADLELSKAAKKPLLVVFSADYCHFCERLKANIIRPMIKSGSYDSKVIFRLVELDDFKPVTGALGQPVRKSDLAQQYGVKVTPTVLIIGPQGEEVAERQVGINNEDYYAAYLDSAIENGLKKIKATVK